MERAYVWRAALVAAGVNVVLNPFVVWLDRHHVHFIPVAKMATYLLAATLAVCLMVSVLGAHRLHRELKRGHRTPHAGSTEEKHLLANLPDSPWQFGLLLGLSISLVASVVLTVVALFDFHGFDYGTFATFVACYTGGLAFLTMRWTIVRQLMAGAARVG